MSTNQAAVSLSISYSLQLKLRTIVVLLFLFTSSIIQAETEPNNTKLTATPILLNNTQTGSVSSSDTQDWWKIVITEAGTIFIHDSVLSATGSSSSLYSIYLYDNDGETLVTSSQSRYLSNTGTRIKTGVLPGNYYLLINRNSYDGSYSLYPEFSAVPEDVPMNDSLEIAQNLVLNSNNYGNIGHWNVNITGTDNEDWWKVVIDEAGELYIYDSISEASGSSSSLYTIFLYDEDGETSVTSSQSRYLSNTGTRIKTGVLPGTYYLRIRRYNYYGSYNLFPEFKPVPEDTIMNDSLEIAQNLVLNSKNYGNIGHWNVNITGTDNEDWWKVVIDEAGELYIYDSISEASGSFSSLYTIFLYDEDGETSVTSSQSRYLSNTGTRIKTGVLPGTYYLRIRRNNYYGSYNLFPEFKPVPEDIVMNDSLEIAQSLVLNSKNYGNIGHWNVNITGTDNEDWWKVVIDEAGELYIHDSISEASGSSSSLYTIFLYDEDGKTSVTSSKTRYLSNTGTRIKTGVLPGTYYLRIRRYNYYGSYNLFPEFKPVPEDTIMNDSLEIAQNLALNSKNYGNIGHWNVNITGTDNEDWWKVVIDEAGELYIHDSISEASGSSSSLYTIFLYDEDGETSVTSSKTRYLSNTGTRIKAAVLPGTYYLRIRSNSYYGSYNLFPEFTPVPKSIFTIHQNVSNILLSNKSVDGERFKWFFGDGTSSEEANTSHVYDEPGDYKVELIASNSVGSDTSAQFVSIYGIRDFNPKQGGNSGPVTLTILGGGMSHETKVKLTCESCEDIEGFNITLIDIGVLQATFNLNAADTGNYTVIIENPGKDSIIKSDAFAVVTGESPKPWVNLLGRSRALLNRWQTYTIEYGNTGNVDAELVPIFITISEPDINEIEFPDMVIFHNDIVIENGWESEFEQMPLYFDVDSFQGEAIKTRVYPLYVQSIPAGFTGSLKLRIKTPGEVQINVWNTEPLVENNVLKSTMENSKLADCLYWAQLKTIADGTVTLIDVVVPGAGCLYSAGKAVYSLGTGFSNAYEERMNGNFEGSASLGSIFGSFLEGTATLFLDCIGSITNIGPIYKLTMDATSKLTYVGGAFNADRECREKFGPENQTGRKVRGVTSFDPNEIVGPTGYGKEGYISGINKASYTIFFENKDTASAPAQEVFVTDTLSAEMFDFSTFSFSAVTIADTTVSMPFGQKEYALDIDMRPKQNIIARCIGKIDTVTGIVNMYFNSLDAETMEQNEDPYAGILLPNVNKPEGEGNVSFSVGVKNVTHDAKFSNEATIVFDFNKPIKTNTWVNTFDLLEPSSEIVDYEFDAIENTLSLNLDGSDKGAGIRYYTIFVSVNDSDYVSLPSSNQETYTYQLPEKSTHLKFFSLATDSLGHEEIVPTGYDIEYLHNVTRTPNTITANSIKIYPNPTSSNITIEGRNIIAINLLDAKGKVLIQKQEPLESTDISLSTLPKGLYFICITTEQGQVNQMLIYR